MKVAELFEGNPIDDLQLLMSMFGLTASQLAKIYGADKPEKAHVARWLKDNKDNVLKQILHEYKNIVDVGHRGNYYSIGDLRAMVRAIRALGLDWPELAALEKSMSK